MLDMEGWSTALPDWETRASGNLPPSGIAARPAGCKRGDRLALRASHGSSQISALLKRY